MTGTQDLCETAAAHVDRIFNNAAPLLLNEQTMAPWIDAIVKGWSELTERFDAASFTSESEADAFGDELVDALDAKADAHSLGFLLSSIVTPKALR